MKINARKPLRLWEQVWDLFLVELTNWRWSWRGMVVVGTIAPLMSMLGLSMFAQDSGPIALQYVWTGNIVLALMFGLQNNVQNHFVFMRENGALHYFATLPIHRSALLLAIIAAFFILNLPAVLMTIIAGAWLLEIPIQPSPLLLLIIPLCSIPMASIGAMIGNRARNPQEAGSINLIVTFLLLAIGPVLFPPDRLPDFMVTLGRLSPATYAASALRQGLVSGLTSQIWIDLAVLAGTSVGMLALVGRWLDWRER